MFTDIPNTAESLGEHQILFSTVVGSRTHGTDNENSDIDTRTVYIVPTRDIVGLGGYKKHIESSEVDNNSWELGHFIYLALRNNPTLLEVFKTPLTETSPWGEELRGLFPHFMGRKKVFDSFRGFASGQRKKVTSLMTTYHRKPKASSHLLRVLYMGIELLRDQDFTVRIMDQPWGQNVWDAKYEVMPFEDVISLSDTLFQELEEAYNNSTMPMEANKGPINEFLLKLRKEYW